MSAIESYPRRAARAAGACYVVNIITSLAAFSGKGSHGWLTAMNIGSTASYVAVTVLFYYLFRPVNRSVSAIAALFGLAGCANGYVHGLLPLRVNSLVFFGCYCLLIGLLIYRSGFLPRFVGVLMGLAGVGWLTFLSAPLAHALVPYHYITGAIGEWTLTAWLLAAGLNEGRWKARASTA